MVAHVSTIALNGVSATHVDVQVQITPGMVSFQIVGLPDNAVRESKERVRGAFHSMGLAMPSKRITVNLSPADIAKEGSHYDLPIAVGLLTSVGALPEDSTDSAFFMGELGLDGSLHPITGCLPAAISAVAHGATKLYVPKANAAEAAWAGGIDVFGLNSLKELINHIKGSENLTPTIAKRCSNETSTVLDLADIRGQESAKRAAEIAAAGGHNMLMVGPPGSGKSMLASRIPGLLPPLDSKEMLEVSTVHSVAGMIGSEGIVSSRPFREPHHSASAVALCGGGIKAKPGEMSLAHKGVLFLDELPEFPRQVLETLRQPLETNQITVSRANHHVTYPANFQLIAAMNPCPCGYLGEADRSCNKAPRCGQNYLSKISGPLLDRFDLHVNVPAVNIKDLSLPPSKEGSAQVAKRVAVARDIQNNRYKNSPNISCNAELSGNMLEEYARPCAEGNTMLQNAADKFKLSARGYHRILRVARTIADLQGVENINSSHIAEALAYRQLK